MLKMNRYDYYLAILYPNPGINLRLSVTLPVSVSCKYEADEDVPPLINRTPPISTSDSAKHTMNRMKPHEKLVLIKIVTMDEWYNCD